ncbi:MAG: IS200/IS605 family transposase [Candidatus Zixiibacteriota bacterium]|jgi:putative transposase
MALIHVAADIATLVKEQKSETAAYILNYHITFRTKRNRRLLKGDIASECREVIRSVADRNNYKILAAAIMPDHVHLVIALTPSDRVSEAVRNIKGNTAKSLRDKYPNLRNIDRSLWSEGYYVESVGLKNVKQVLNYVSRQDEHHEYAD